MRQSADTWACGVMLFIMLTSAYPFGRPEDEQLKPSAKMHVMLQVPAHRPGCCLFALLSRGTRLSGSMRF